MDDNYIKPYTLKSIFKLALMPPGGHCPTTVEARNWSPQIDRKQGAVDFFLISHAHHVAVFALWGTGRCMD